MADNYLERRYEDYEAKKQAWERAKKLGKVKPKKPSQQTQVKKENINDK